MQRAGGGQMRRCWTTWPSGRRIAGGAPRGRAVGDGAGVRRAASAVRADARSARAPAAPQRDALGTAFGLQRRPAAGPVPGRAGGARAALGGGRGAAAVCVVDDAQWLDRASAQALAFVARRLLAESVALCRGARARDRRSSSRAAGAAGRRAAGCRCAGAAGLGDPRAAGRAGARPDRRRDARQSAGAAGAAARSCPPKLAGGFGLPDGAALTGRIEDSFRRRLAGAARRDPAAAPAGARPSRPAIRCCSARGRAARASAPTLPRRPRRPGLLRVRRPGAVPPSAGALGGLPGGAGCRTPARCTGRWRSHRPEPIPTAAPGTAPRPPRARRGGRRRAGALGRPGAGARWAGRGGRVPGARGGADARPGAAGQRALAAAQAKYQAGAPDAALELLAAAEAGPLDELSRARVDAAARPDRVRLERAAATRRRCCSRRPGGSSRSTRAGPRDLPGRAVRGDVRRAGSAGAAGVLEVADGRASRAAPPAPPRAVRPPARRPGRCWSPRGCAAAAPMLKRALQRFADDEIAQARRAALAAGSRAVAAVDAVGRRELAGARRPPASQLARDDRRARRASARAHVHARQCHLGAASWRRGRSAGRRRPMRSARRPGATAAPYGAADARRARRGRGRGAAADRGRDRGRDGRAARARRSRSRE